MNETSRNETSIQEMKKRNETSIKEIKKRNETSMNQMCERSGAERTCGTQWSTHKI